jgi:O-antigen ligase
MNPIVTRIPIPAPGPNPRPYAVVGRTSDLRGQILEVIPGLRFAFFAVLAYSVYYAFQGPSIPYDETSLSGLVEQTQAGDVSGRIVIVTLGLIGAFLLARSRHRIKLQPWVAIVLFALLAWSATSVLWSTDPSLSVRRLASLALMTSFSAGCAASMNTFSLSAFIAGIPVLSIVVGVVFELVLGRFRPFGAEYRFCGMAPHPNVEGAYLSVGVILLAWLCWRTKGIIQARFIFATIITIGFLALTGSRTSLIAVGAALALSLLLILARDARGMVPVLAALLCLIIAIGSLSSLVRSNGLSISPFATVLHRESQGNDPSVFNGREDLWGSLIPYFARRPWVGYGFGAFWSPDRIEEVSLDQGWAIQQSHCGYLDQLLALGIPGALLYVGLLLVSIGWSVRQFLRHRDGYGAWAAVLAFIAVHNGTESINVSSSFTNLTFYMIISHLALVRSDRSNVGSRLAISQERNLQGSHRVAIDRSFQENATV